MSATPSKLIYSTQMVAVNENTFDMNIVYTNSDTAVLRAEKSDEQVTYYMDEEKIVSGTIEELNALKS